MANRISEYFRIRKQEKEEFARFLEDTSKQISVAYHEYADIFHTPSYIDIHTTNAWKQRFNSLHDTASSYLKDGMIEKKKLPRKYVESFAKMGAMYAHIDEQRIKHNNKNTSPKKNDAISAFAKILEGKAPTEEQLSAILSKDSRVLISGAPSTGKTTTLKAKMEYLSLKHSKEDMLFVSAADLDRIAGIAKNVLEKSGINTEKLHCSEASRDILPAKAKEFLSERSSDNSYRNRLIDYYLKFHAAGHTVFEFDSREEYDKFIKIFPPVSLKGEHLKSYEELDIANFLYALGVEYEYHAPFKADVSLKGARTRYKADFTLKDYNICINVYELDESGSVAESDESALADAEYASKQYEETINDIRAIHEEAEVPLIECYSRDKHTGSMLSKLQTELSASGVSFNIKNDAELIEAIMQREPGFIDILSESLCDGVTIMLASEMSEDMLLDLSRTKSKTASALYRRHERMMSLIMPFYNYYIKEVPFDNYRIIARAASALHDGKAVLDYKHIFIDDMENMCACAMRFITNLANACSCAVTAAGSQWTSYTGHFGADSMYLTEFGRFMPGFCDVECTRVFDMPKGIFDTMQDFAVNGGGFMGYKPVFQDNDGRIVRIDKSGKSIETLSVRYADNSNVCEKLAELISLLPSERSVLVVCRYDAEVRPLEEMLAAYDNVKCSSIFDSEGKYDVVIWINTKYSDFGFPDERLCLNNISALALRRPLSSIFDAERSMLCKAMAHTIDRFILLYDENDASDYVAELTEFADR